MRRPRIEMYFFAIAFVVIVVILLIGLIHSPKPPLPLSTNSQAIQPYPGVSAAEQPNAKCRMNGVLPDLSCTPGAINPAVTQANINQTICVSGYTKTIRPPTEYTDQLKRQQMIDYGFTDSLKYHEEDHLISLELGGAPSDPKNLWPEPHASPNAKDKVEDFLHAAVCQNKLTLQDAQHRIATDWTTAEQGI